MLGLFEKRRLVSDRLRVVMGVHSSRIDAARKLEEVIAKIGALAMRGGRDGASLLLLQRLQLLREAIPDAWDGTWTFEEK